MTKQHTLGIIGGMSWESTLQYYRLINQGVKKQLGGLHSADILLHSLDFAPIEALQSQNDWDAMGEKLAESALGLKNAGAQGILIATNTMHKVADEVVSATELPIVHIADSTADVIEAKKQKTVALLGTNFTMTEAFYKDRLHARGLDVLIPEEDERADIHRIIYGELCKGRIKDSSRRRYIEIILNLAARGAEGVILGCTEIGMLICQDDSPITVYDTTEIHADAAVSFLLGI